MAQSAMGSPPTVKTLPNGMKVTEQPSWPPAVADKTLPPRAGAGIKTGGDALSNNLMLMQVIVVSLPLQAR